MEDRVGDVLAQRATLDRGIAAGIALSLLLHGGLTAAAIWAATRHREVLTAGIMTIKFAQVQRPRTVTAPPITQAAPAAPKPAPLEKPEVPQQKPTPSPPKPEKNTVPFSPFGKSNKKGSEAAKPSVATAPVQATKPGVTNATDVPVGGAGVTALEGGEFTCSLCLQRMNALIANHWRRPEVGPQATATVYFVVERDGNVRDVKLEKSSGNDAYDRAALRAVLENPQLPPLPFSYDGTYLGVHLTFR